MNGTKLPERLWLVASIINAVGVVVIWCFTDVTFSGYAAGATAAYAMFEITRLRRRLNEALALLRTALATPTGTARAGGK